AASVVFALLSSELADSVCSPAITTSSHDRPTKRISASCLTATFVLSTFPVFPHSISYVQAFRASHSVSPAFQRRIVLDESMGLKMKSKGTCFHTSLRFSTLIG